MIHLTFLVRKLTSTVATCLIDNEWRLNLEVATLASFLQEESFESSLEASHLANIEWETSTCDLYTKVEVDEVEFLAQIPMAHSIFR